MSEPNQWLAYAVDDLAYGELGMAALPRAASWSFQQATEKALKALLLAKRREVPRTHDVAYLLSQLAPLLSLSDVVKDAALLIAEITPATRYPGDDLPPIETEDAHAYFQAAKQLVDWVAHEINS